MNWLRAINLVIIFGASGAAVAGIRGWSWVVVAVLAALGGTAFGFKSAIWFFAHGLKNENPKLMKAVTLAQMLGRRGR